jgi:hypothetical protein
MADLRIYYILFYPQLGHTRNACLTRNHERIGSRHKQPHGIGTHGTFVRFFELIDRKAA